MFGENNSGDAGPEGRDRRTSRRFPLRLAVRYRATEARFSSEWTAGESVNISSDGLLITTPEAVKAGQTVEAVIAWPVLLDQRIPLKLVITGFIVRSSEDHTAMRFTKYQFRTCRTPAENQSYLARPVNPSASI
jgi:hypothetical protein